MSPTPAQDDDTFRHLRRSLIKFFYLRRLADAEDLAQETIKRLLEKQAAGVVIMNVPAYTKGIAKRVAAAEAGALAETGPVIVPSHNPPAEPLLLCLARCLNEVLARGDRSFLMRYYGFKEGAKVESRKMLATKERITIQALRVKVSRLLKRLRPCMVRCMENSSPR